MEVPDLVICAKAVVVRLLAQEGPESVFCPLAHLREVCDTERCEVDLEHVVGVLSGSACNWATLRPYHRDAIDCGSCIFTQT